SLAGAKLIVGMATTVTSGQARRLARFGAFELDINSGELRKHGVRVKLQARSFQILKALLEAPGAVVTREELRGRLWHGETFVDLEGGLIPAVNRLRLALGDSAENPRYVETLARTGYRFVFPVEQIEIEPGGPSDRTPPAESGRQPRRSLLWLAALA